jgi:hypothetical protein
MYAPGDARVRGLVLLNPWVRSETTFARTQVKHYYSERILQPELWQKVANGDFAWRESLSSFARTVKSFAKRNTSPATTPPFQARMARALSAFQGRTLLLLAGEDLTAKEFLEHVQNDAQWKGALDGERVTRIDFPECDHTFSDRESRLKVENATTRWLRSW